jgi:simple sugar transport system ATP-binding protein
VTSAGAAPADAAVGGGDRPVALRLAGITKRFGSVVANDRVSLELRRGEILGLLGENGAGKSTLMNVVFGLYQPDDGHVEVAGERVDIRSPAQAAEHGIGMVHQHFMLVPDMTVAENLALAPSFLPRLSRLSLVSERIRELSRRFGLGVDPGARIGDLPLGARQRVEIMKLLYRGAEILILDEPTAALTPQEWQQLADFLRSLAAEGKSIILITHKLDELFGVASRCTVLRDGAVVDTVELAGTDKASLARMMVGRDVSLRIERRLVARGAPVVDIDGISLEANGRRLLSDLSFRVHQGEVFGVAGVAGNGQDELVELLAGLRAPTEGEVWLEGEAIAGRGPDAFIRGGGAIIPEDRHRAAVALDMTLWENLVIKELKNPELAPHGLLRRGYARATSERLVAEYGIRTSGVDAAMRELSGGNQQKAVFARELSRRPRFLIASQPTRGLDVGAMEFVYRRLNECKQAGTAILLLSIELDEILSLSDRIAVLYEGRIVGILDADDADPDRIGLLMGGGMGASS